MIAFLRGNASEFEKNAVLLDVHGLGYRVYMPQRILLKCASLQAGECFLYTYHHIREDIQDLYGFLQKSDMECFLLLLSVSGIGPKSAIEMLEHSSEILFQAIESEDVAFLSSLKGIGKKTASRMILELKGKIVLSDKENDQESRRNISDIEAALQNLGFQREHIRTLLSNVPTELVSSEDILRWALKNSAR
jgi:holliday junction DNA helicase RuvA